MTQPLVLQTGPDLAPVAPPATASLAEVLRYQESLWERGDGRCVEDLVADRPQLRATPDALLELVYNEVILREEAGESPQLAEYQQRFPELAEPLRLQLRLDGFLASRRSARQARLSGGNAIGTDQPADGKRIGRYEIQGVLGKGGMGIAYRAWDPQLKRVVALKVLRAGQDADAIEIARFRAEAEAIARVRHPNILQVFDVGEHLGQPFFAMEFCGGGSLAERLNGSPLPATEAARLLEQIARGVAAAHQQQIVHRDLKPGNVLLTEETACREPGVAERETTGAAKTRTDSKPSSGTSVATAQFKVTDFGLAKKLDDEGGQTRTGAVMGTPAYMAPEQAFGDSARVGPTADVYALGAILYECLTGRPPFKGATIPDTLDLVRHREPVPVRQLQPRTPLDLETITLKCLQKDPSKRYATAQEVADDLGRFLDGRPIVARPIGPLARAWRWAKRNRVVATLLSLTFGVLLAGITSTSLALREANQNLTKSEARARETFRAVNKSFVLISQERLLHEPGMKELRRELLEASLPFYENFVAERGDDPRWRRELADASDRMGGMHYNLGSHTLAHEHYKKALALYQKLHDEDPSNRDLADSLGGCWLNLGHSFMLTKQFDEAEQAYKEGLAVYRQLQADWPRVEILTHLADLESLRGKLPESLVLASEAVDLGRKLIAHQPNKTKAAFQLGNALFLRATIHSRMAQTSHTLHDLDAAAKLYEPLLRKRDRIDSAIRSALAKVRAMQGAVYIGLQRPKEATAALQAANEELKLLVRMHPTAQVYSQHYSTNLYNLTHLHGRLGQFKQADESHDLSIKERERLHRQDPRNLTHVLTLAESYRQGAALANWKQQFEDAIPWNDRCIAVLQPELQRDPKNADLSDRLSRAASAKAQTLTRFGRYAESLPLWDLSLDNGGAPDPLVVRMYRAKTRAMVGDWRAAELDIQTVLATKGAEKNATILFALGCTRAAMAVAVTEDDSLSVQERQTRSETLVQAALALLGSARKLGHQHDAWNRQQWSEERALLGLSGFTSSAYSVSRQ